MYIFDNKTQCFFPLALKDRYIAAGTWPENGVEVDDDTFSEFRGAASRENESCRQ